MTLHWHKKRHQGDDEAYYLKVDTGFDERIVYLSQRSNCSGHPTDPSSLPDEVIWSNASRAYDLAGEMLAKDDVVVNHEKWEEYADAWWKPDEEVVEDVKKRMQDYNKDW